jgi:hypothetical protein
VLTARLSLQKHASPRLVQSGGSVTFSLHVKNVTEVSALTSAFATPCHAA